MSGQDRPAGGASKRTLPQAQPPIVKAADNLLIAFQLFEWQAAKQASRAVVRFEDKNRE